MVISLPLTYPPSGVLGNFDRAKGKIEKMKFEIVDSNNNRAVYVRKMAPLLKAMAIFLLPLTDL